MGGRRGPGRRDRSRRLPPYDPVFFLQIDLGRVEVADDAEEILGGEKLTIRASEADYEADQLCNQLTEDEAAAVLASACCRWYGSDEHSGDCSRCDWCLLGSPELEDGLAVEAESWQLASIDNAAEYQRYLDEIEIEAERFDSLCEEAGQ